MATKQKRVKPVAKNDLTEIRNNQRKESAMMADMMRKERLMKWLLIGLAILLLLLILFAGYATDWLRGVTKDSASGDTGISATSDAATAPNESTGGSGGGSTTTNGGTNSTNTSSRTDTSTNTSKESSSSTTTNNTTNNNTTTPDNSNKSGLLSLYTDTSAGDNISDVINNASLLGVSKNCHNEVLIQVCDFTEGDRTVTVKNLLGTGLVTSIVKNF